MIRTRGKVHAFLMGCLISGGAPSLWSSPWPSEVQRVRQVFETGDVSARRLAAQSLSSFSEDASTGVIRMALRDEDLQVRLSAARVAIAFDLWSFNEAVRPWLSSNDPEERLVAVELLSRKPEESDIALLSRSLSDSELRVRAAAAVGLGRVTSRHESLARPALMNALDDAEAKVRIEVASALGKIGDASVSVAVAAHLPDPEPSVRAQLALALGTIGDSSVVPALLVATRDPYPEVVAKVAEALGRMSAEESVPTLTAILRQDPQGEAGRAAARALFRIKTPSALAELSKSLDDERTANFASSLLENLESEAQATIQLCIETAVGVHLERCVALASSAGVPVARLLEAQNEGRIRAETLLRLSSGRSDPDLEILALELLEEGQTGRSVALAYLQSVPMISKAAEQPLVAALRELRLTGPEVVLLSRVISRSDTLDDPAASKWGVSLLESTEPTVRAAAAALLVACGAQGQLLDGLLLHQDGEVARQAAFRLSRGMTAEQAATVVQLLTKEASGRRRLLLSTLAGLPAGVAPDLLERLLRQYEQASGRERDALLMAFVNNGSAKVMGRLMDVSGRADLLKLAQISAFHPTSSSWTPRLLKQGDARLKSVALVALGMQGASKDAALVVPFVSAAAGRPFYLRAAALSALVLMRERGLEFAYPPTLLSNEFCDSEHIGLRTQALRFASQVGKRCGDAVLADTLRFGRSTPLRETAAQLLARDDPGSTALRRCVAYEPRAAVAAWCDPVSVEAAATNSGAQERRFEILQLDDGVDGRKRSFTPVALQSVLGTYVTVTDRSGEFLVPSGRRTILPSILTY